MSVTPGAPGGWGSPYSAPVPAQTSGLASRRRRRPASCSMVSRAPRLTPSPQPLRSSRLAPVSAIQRVRLGLIDRHQVGDNTERVVRIGPYRLDAVVCSGTTDRKGTSYDHHAGLPGV